MDLGGRGPHSCVAWTTEIDLDGNKSVVQASGSGNSSDEGW